MSRELTTEETIKYKKEINRSRLGATAFSIGYEMKEMINEEGNEIVTMAKGEQGWVPIGYCDINK